MRDREWLLSLEEPVALSFSHSALREGWDNPNIFRICTLNWTISMMVRRQEIWREMEGMKIDCARRHFEAIEVDYDVVTGVEELRSRR